ncbi:MAG: hypothetical protein SFU98_06310 [Leptospiraceae bacterium]|nr:hypothetical protein [Leptospiraceae bacterium]
MKLVLIFLIFVLFFFVTRIIHSIPPEGTFCSNHKLGIDCIKFFKEGIFIQYFKDKDGKEYIYWDTWKFRYYESKSYFASEYVIDLGSYYLFVSPHYDEPRGIYGIFGQYTYSRFYRPYPDNPEYDYERVDE